VNELDMLRFEAELERLEKQPPNEALVRLFRSKAPWEARDMKPHDGDGR